jgi:anthranilate phosphoribosyltransferase
VKTSEAELRRFGAAVQRVIGREDLSREECRELFRQILMNEQPDLQQGALLAALAAKGETAAEAAGAWEAVDGLDTRHVELEDAPPLVENSGTGMDRVKTFNVSSAAAVVAAAGGVRMARHGARGITSTCGTVDVLEAVGVNVECEIDVVAKSIRECGIGLFNGMCAQVHPGGLFRILSCIRFGSILNIAASLANPCRPRHAVRGVHAPSAVRPVAEVMRAIGYRRAMVVHGFAQGESAIDELSTLGNTLIYEIRPDNTDCEYTLAPEELGIRRANITEVATTGDPESEADRLLLVLGGAGPSALNDFTSLNAAAIFVVAGRTPDLEAGLLLSRDLLQSGKPLEVLWRWVRAQAHGDASGIERLRARVRRVGLENHLCHLS